jgi:hypothetical protein
MHTLLSRFFGFRCEVVWRLILYGHVDPSISMLNYGDLVKSIRGRLVNAIGTLLIFLLNPKLSKSPNIIVIDLKQKRNPFRSVRHLYNRLVWIQKGEATTQ